MNDFATRFKEARARAGTSVAEIAKKLGVSVQSVYGWESGAVPKGDRLERLAEFLDVDLHWLAFGQGAALALRDEDGDLAVPLLDTVTKAGHNTADSSGRVISFMKLDALWARGNLRLSNTRSVAMIAVSGDSMEPTLKNGNMVLVDTAVASIDVEAIYVVRCGNSDFIKRFQRLPNGRLLMISDNSFYKEIEIDPTSDQFQVLGRAIYVWQGVRLF